MTLLTRICIMPYQPWCLMARPMNLEQRSALGEVFLFIRTVWQSQVSTESAFTFPAKCVGSAKRQRPREWPSPFILYMANAGSNNVSAYTINAATGALTPVGGLALHGGKWSPGGGGGSLADNLSG